MENSSEFYYEKLKSTDTPGKILASFYCTLFNKQVTNSEIIMCNKLVKVFDRFLVYFSILDLAGSSKTIDEVYPYLYAICQRRFENAHGYSNLPARVSLDKYIAEMAKEIEKVLKENKKNPPVERIEADGGE